MIFEVELSNQPQCHQNLQPALELFKSQKVNEAFQFAFAEIRKKTDSCELNENDWLLLSTLANACGFTMKARAIHQFAYARHSESILLTAMHAWDLSAYGRYFECQALLEKVVDRAADWKGLILAIQAYNYSLMRWDKTGEEYHEKAIAEAGDNPLTWYVLSRAAAKRTDWNRAVEEGRRVLGLCPTWSRARAALGDSLLSIGEVDEAEQVLQVDAIPSIRMDFLKAMCCQATHKTKKAIALLAQLVQAWPRQTRLAKYAVRQLTLLLMQNGQFDAVNVIVDEFKLEEFKVDGLKESDSNKQKYISMPLVSQTRNHCVPTLAAMVAGSQDIEASPKQYAEGMNTRHGTPMWRLVDFMKSQGFRVVCVRPDIEIAKAMLEQNVPLIGELTHIFSGHVDCVCGYDDRLERFYLRDPMHWHGSSIKFEDLAPRYNGSASLWAMIAPHRIDEVTVKSEWENVEGQAMIDLSRACCQGDRLKAEEAYDQIADDSRLAFQRDSIARSVVLTGRKYQARVREVVDGIGEDEKIEYFQIRALLQLIDEDNADQLLEYAKRNLEMLSRTFVKYIEAQCLYAKSQWHEALEAFTDVCHLWPSLDSLWSQLAQVQQQLGMADEARESLAIAMEVAPDQGRHQTTHLYDRESDIPFNERLEAALELVEQYPDSTTTRLTLAQVMADTGQGTAYEKALRTAIKYFPRYEWPYQRLANWYMCMSREDMAHDVLKEGRDLMGLEEIPYWTFEVKSEDIDTPESGEKSDGQLEADEATKIDDESSNVPLPQNEELKSESSPVDDGANECLDEQEPQSTAKYYQLWERASENFSLPHAEFEELEAVKGLIELDRQQRLHWWQSVRVLSFRISNLFNDQTVLFTRKNSHRADALKSLLPNEVPGVAECFVLEFFENFDFARRPHDCQQVLLEWLDEMTPNREEYARLCFHRAYLLEQIGRFNESEEQLKRIVERHSAHYASFYRLGQICKQRGELIQARSYFEQCLSVSPGNSGSVESLIEIAERVGDDVLDLRVRLWQMQPYSHSYLYNVAREFASTHDAQKAHKFLNDQHSLFDPKRFPVIKARLCVETEDFEQAKSLIESLPDEGPDYSAEWVLIDCEIARGDFKAVIDQVSKMLETWPHDQDLIDQMARALRELDMKEAKSFSRKKLLEGYDVPLLAYNVLEGESAPEEIAIELMQKMKLEYRDDIAHTMNNMLARVASIRQSIKFMQFCSQRMSHLRDIRRMLAYDLLSIGMVDMAIEVAELLVVEQPENPEFLECLGYCLQESQPLRAIEVLEKAFALTGKVETLSDLARSYQIQGDDAKARELHWKTLEIDPTHTVAMTNLHWKFDDDSKIMLDMMLKTFDNNGANFNAEYFLVTAVLLAKKHQVQLPVCWLEHSLQRALSIQKYGGFHDEGELLGSFIEIWLDQWLREGSPDEAQAVGEVWIPNKPTDYEFPEIAGTDGLEALAIAISITGTLPEYMNEQHSYESIGRYVQAAEACIRRERWDDAEKNFQAAIDCFDETVSETERQAIVRRWLDSKNKGSLIDKMSNLVPFDIKNEHLALPIGALSAFTAAIFMFIAKKCFAAIHDYTLIGATVSLMLVPCAVYCTFRWFETKKNLARIEKQHQIDRTVRGTVQTTERKSSETDMTVIEELAQVENSDSESEPVGAAN